MSFDFTGVLHWFPIATDRIVGLSPKVDLGLKRQTDSARGKEIGEGKRGWGLEGRSERERGYEYKFLLNIAKRALFKD